MQDPSESRQQLSSSERVPLDPDAETMRRWGYELVDRVVAHLTTLSEQPVAAPGTRAEFEALVDEPLPIDPAGIEDCLKCFFDRVVPKMTRVNHPRFHAYIPAPSSFAGALGEMLAAGTNPFAGTWLGGATISALELTVLRWIAEMLGYAPDAAGILTSGGSLANLVALTAARTRLESDHWQRGRIYVSREGHASVIKAARILGFPCDAIRTVPANAKLQMDFRELANMIAADRAGGHVPFFVAGNGGTTNSGAVDPLHNIADICANAGLWFHVDAAYGGFAALTPRGRTLLRGMERADSLTLDPHKWLYCSMGVGCVLVRHADALEVAFSSHADYLQDLPSDEVNFFNRGVELSRPARVLSVWMVIRSIGRDGLAKQIGADMRLARLAAQLLAADSRLEVHTPVLSIVTFRHRLRSGESESQRASRDMALMETTLASGELMLSTTRLDGKMTLRLAVMNHRTTESEIRRSVQCIRALIA